MSLLRCSHVTYRIKEIPHVVSLIFFLMSLGYMSHVNFKKCPCCRIEFRGRGPLFRLRTVMSWSFGGKPHPTLRRPLWCEAQELSEHMRSVPILVTAIKNSSNYTSNPSNHYNGDDGENMNTYRRFAKSPAAHKAPLSWKFTLNLVKVGQSYGDNGWI